MQKRIVCWFSCGAASAVATKLSIKKYGKENVVVVRCVVHDEHYDNDRFANDCQKWFGVKILNIANKKYGGSVDEVIRQTRYISGPQGAPCTRLLKKEVRIEFQLQNDKHIFGYTAEEQDRFDDFIDANNIDVEAPLIEQSIKHEECLALIEKAGIKLPVMYTLGYKHNNCIGCLKSGGQGYWNKIKKDFPYIYEKRCQQSRALGSKMLNVKGVHKFLDELEEGAGNYKEEPEIQCGIFCEMVNKYINEQD